MATLNPEEARAYLSRWDLVHQVEVAELRGTSLDRKLEQLEALVASGHLCTSENGPCGLVIDALAILPEDEWQRVVDSSGQYGIEARIDDALAFARRSRVLLLRHIASGIDLDVTFGGLDFERSAVESALDLEIGGISIRLPRVEDLLVMKAIAGRPKDLEDIRGLLDGHPEADCEEARRWIREFATAASMPDLLSQFEKLLQERKS